MTLKQMFMPELIRHDIIMKLISYIISLSLRVQEIPRNWRWIKQRKSGIQELGLRYWAVQDVFPYTFQVRSKFHNDVKAYTNPTDFVF